MTAAADTSRQVDAKGLISALEALGRFGALPNGGVHRRTFSPAYRDAVDWLTQRMEGAGLRVRTDPVGNLIGRLGPEGPAVICGSHIDSVPGGGIYDGALGVLAGIECARALKAEESQLVRAMEVVAFADEEGAYLSLLGSRTMVGDLPEIEVSEVVGRDGQRLQDALQAYGLDPNRIGAAARKRVELAGYIELHIEQGPVLEANGDTIGVVEAIVGIHQSKFVFSGMANHAGTTPMALRKDALRCAAQAMTEMYRVFAEEFAADMRLTYGAISVHPNASNVIPARVDLTQEIRGPSAKDIERLFQRSEQVHADVAKRYGVSVDRSIVSVNRPATMSAIAVGRITRACERHRLRYRRMVSGAGHDAQVFAEVCETAMIFVPSGGGISHQMLEETSPRDISAGLDVLYGVLREWLGLDG